MRLELRCAPSSGRSDLAWLAEMVGSLDDIYDFLLRTEIADDVERIRTLSSEALARAVDGRAVELGSPIVHVREGSTIIELAAQLIDSTIPVQVLASLAILIKKGPEVVAWPGHVKKAWYDGRAEAQQAQLAYQRLTERSTVEVIEDGVEPLAQPGKGRGPKRKRPHTDLPRGVRRAPRLDS